MGKGVRRKIKTHSTETFRQHYMKPEKKLNEMLKSDFGKFFITKVEDMIRLIKLPVPPTRSTNHSFIYLTKGEAVMSIGGETYTIYNDQILIVPAGQIFSFNNVDRNNGYLFHFNNDFLIGKFDKNSLLKTFEFLNVWGNSAVKLDKEVSTYVHQLLKRIFNDYTEYGLLHMDILQSYVISLLCEINLKYVSHAASNQHQSIHVTNKFKALLYKNFRSQKLVADYASLLHISPNHLNKIVKQITGKSPTKWIDEVLILEAKILLYQTDFTISEIAEEIGISDQSYFSRLFKKYEGLSPIEFRKRIEMS
jgi:AraC-like DNA-binding protein/mannose-6-phosphate isomerase-like protein (cupin superfamily)